MDKRTGRFTCWPGAGPFTARNSVPRVPSSPDWCHYIQAIDDGTHRPRLPARPQAGHRGPAERMPCSTSSSRSRRERRPSRTSRSSATSPAVAGWQPSIHTCAPPSNTTRSITIPDEGHQHPDARSQHAVAGMRTKGLAFVDLANGSVRTALTHRPWTSDAHRRSSALPAAG